MVLALLPHWRERRFGHVVNVSSAGVQAISPKYSAYVPSKAALDAFAEVVGTETLSDHITFTSIHMPLVKTPMIAPSRKLNPMPAISPEHAAAMVVRGLVEKPARIDTPVGTLADFGTYFTPKLSRRVLHQLYLSYPDSAAARGVLPVPGASEATGGIRSEPDDTEVRRPARRPKRPARSAVAKMRMPRPIKRAVRLVPGVHW
jgi:NAD(P)-dependent dehydrogenase (short-subunit alcohol dehydrogenase family)